jgi:ribosome-binding protein aMBF1 (putative translation factor)
MSGDRQRSTAKGARDARVADGRPGPEEIERLHSGVGRIIREHRADAEMSQADLARAVGCSQSLISMLESGKVRPRRDTLSAITWELSWEIWASDNPDSDARRLANVLEHAAGDFLAPDTDRSRRAWRRRARRAKGRR